MFQAFIILFIMWLPFTAAAAEPVYSPLTVHIQFSDQGVAHELFLPFGQQMDTLGVKVSKGIKRLEQGKLLFLNLSTSRDIILQKVEVIAAYDKNGTSTVFCNGFQGWTTSREYGTSESIKAMGGLGKKLAGNYGDYRWMDYARKKGNLHSWTYTYQKDTLGNYMFFGSLNEYMGYTYFRVDAKQRTFTIGKEVADLFMPQNTSRQLIKIWIGDGPLDDAYKIYGRLTKDAIQEVAQARQIVLPDSLPNSTTGWTSWYHYYHDIDEGIILDNLHAFQKGKVSAGYFQIDDGYQAATGDWLLTNSKFPRGMKPLADSIHTAGYKAGIWLAPFICVSSSQIYQQHPDWLLRDSKGKPLVVGLNPGWGGKYYALDIYNQDFREFLMGELDTILRIWGYDLIKVDFLFAAHLMPPQGKTRGEVMSDALLLLRELAGPDKMILGCGIPLGPAFHLVDYCRISSDIHMKWEQRLLKWIQARERLSCWNNATTTIGRYQLAGNMFQNDPDVYVLRDEKNKLNQREKFSLFLINNLLGKLIFTSDNISHYSKDQMQLYQSALPYMEKQIHQVLRITKDLYQIEFSIEDREYLALINLGKKKFRYDLQDQYFDGMKGEVVQGKVSLKPHSSICLYQIKGTGFEVLGQSNSLFAGRGMKMEVLNDKNLKLKYQYGADETRPIIINLPKEFQQIKINGTEAVHVPADGLNLFRYQPIK